MSAGGLAASANATVPELLQRPLQPLTRPALADTLPGAAPDTGAPRTLDLPLARAAREGADMVGDACLAWRVVDGGRLEPAATHHRDRRLRYALGAFLHQATLEPASRWPGQVVRHGAPVRLRKARLRDLGIDPGVGMRRAHALLVPVLDGDRVVAVIAALRETREPTYSLREEVVARRVGAKTARWMGLGSSDGNGNGNERSDHASGGGGQPPDDGDWTPPPTWLLDHVGVGMWLTDRVGVTTYVNTAMTEMLGVPSSEVDGRPMRDFLEDVPQMLRGEFCMEEERCDRRVTQPDGRHIWVEMISLPLLDRQGRRQGTLNTAVDVTDRKKVELAARQRVPRAHRRL